MELRFGLVWLVNQLISVVHGVQKIKIKTVCDDEILNPSKFQYMRLLTIQHEIGGVVFSLSDSLDGLKGRATDWLTESSDCVSLCVADSIEVTVLPSLSSAPPIVNCLVGRKLVGRRNIHEMDGWREGWMEGLDWIHSHSGTRTRLAPAAAQLPGSPAQLSSARPKTLLDANGCIWDASSLSDWVTESSD